MRLTPKAISIYKPKAMSEFDKLADDASFLVRGVATLIVVSIFTVLVAIPFVIYSTIRDTIFCAKSNTVWLIEQNAAIEYGIEGYLQPEEPIIYDANDSVSRYYFKGHSIKEAEDWLLSHGYQKAQLQTPLLSNNYKTVEGQKIFPVKPLRNLNTFSSIAMIVDYGDGNKRLVPYEYYNGKSPWDLSVLPDVKPDFYTIYNYPDLPFYSTHKAGLLQSRWVSHAQPHKYDARWFANHTKIVQ